MFPSIKHTLSYCSVILRLGNCNPQSSFINWIPIAGTRGRLQGWRKKGVLLPGTFCSLCLTVPVGTILAMDFTPAAAASCLVATFDSGLHFSNTRRTSTILPLLGTPAPAVSAPSSEVWVSPHRSRLQAPETTVQLSSALSQWSEFQLGRGPSQAPNLTNP